jgi:hypothetical protein
VFCGRGELNHLKFDLDESVATRLRFVTKMLVLAIIVVHSRQKWDSLGLLSNGHSEAEQRQAQSEIDTLATQEKTTSLTEENMSTIVSILSLVDETAKSTDKRLKRGFIRSFVDSIEVDVYGNISINGRFEVKEETKNIIPRYNVSRRSLENTLVSRLDSQLFAGYDYGI